jgi:ATP-dependent Lon protease
MTGRNQDAIKKTTAGLLKLLHPHKSPDNLEPQEMIPFVELAVESRKRVTDQLAVMLPAEFRAVEHGFRLRKR